LARPRQCGTVVARATIAQLAARANNAGWYRDRRRQPDASCQLTTADAGERTGSRGDRHASALTTTVTFSVAGAYARLSARRWRSYTNDDVVVTVDPLRDPERGCSGNTSTMPAAVSTSLPRADAHGIRSS
jgi:hypothetical protein